jgi:hypothetical protein
MYMLCTIYNRSDRVVSDIQTRVEGETQDDKIRNQISGENINQCTCANESLFEPNLSYTHALKKRNYIRKTYLPICFRTQNLHKIWTIANLMQSRPLPHLHRFAKIVQIYFFAL